MFQVINKNIFIPIILKEGEKKHIFYEYVYCIIENGMRLSNTKQNKLHLWQKAKDTYCKHKDKEHRLLSESVFHLAINPVFVDYLKTELFSVFSLIQVVQK